VGVSQTDSLAVWSRSLRFDEAVGVLAQDVLLVEGARNIGALPRIVCLKEESDIDRLRYPGSADAEDPRQFEPDKSLVLASVGIRPERTQAGHFDEISLETAEALALLVLERGFLLPALDCKACGQRSCAALASDIVAQKADLSACKTLARTLSLTSGGVELQLNPFVARIISASLLGIMRELKGYRPGQEIVVKMRGS
jgi:molybdopterin-guanine dinucleotide biosynthesis protein B